MGSVWNKLIITEINLILSINIWHTFLFGIISSFFLVAFSTINLMARECILLHSNFYRRIRLAFLELNLHLLLPAKRLVIMMTPTPLAIGKANTKSSMCTNLSSYEPRASGQIELSLGKQTNQQVPDMLFTEYCIWLSVEVNINGSVDSCLTADLPFKW